MNKVSQYPYYVLGIFFFVIAALAGNIWDAVGSTQTPVIMIAAGLPAVACISRGMKYNADTDAPKRSGDDA